MTKLGLKFDLNIGLKVNGETVKEVELLTSNSVAEEVFTRKLSQEPFTWIGNVISVAVGSIGETRIAEAVRQEYFKTGKVTIPKIVRDISFADANSLLLEIHRRVWQHKFDSMETMCRYCAKSIEVDVDLNNIKLTEEQELILETTPEFNGIAVDLTPFSLDSLIKDLKGEEVSTLLGTTFNRFTYRIPTLGDAIKNQDYFDRNIELWRRIGADCLVSIQKVDEEGNVVADIPENYIRFLSIKLYRDMDVANLKKIRHALREELPVLPFAYMDSCACDSRRKIPYTLESSGFFSE
jgi:hypothetical protein